MERAQLCPTVAEREHAAWPEMGRGPRKSRPSQRCDRRLRQQAGKNRLGECCGAENAVRCHRNARGGMGTQPVALKTSNGQWSLREGNGGMA